LKPEDFEGQQCFMSADLSTKLDLTCIMKVFHVGNSYYCFPKFYLPSERALDPSLGMYARWVSTGHLIATEGTQIDMEQVLEETVADIERYKPSEFAFDQYKAEMFTQLLGCRCPGTTLVEIPMHVKHISQPMLETEVLVACKTLKHADNPVMNWCMSNVVAKPDVKGNIYPKKTRNENKIDGALCLIMAVLRAQAMAPAATGQSFTPFFV